MKQSTDNNFKKLKQIQYLKNLKFLTICCIYVFAGCADTCMCFSYSRMYWETYLEKLYQPDNDKKWDKMGFGKD